MPAVALSPVARSRALDELDGGPVEVLVVGGGVVGAGIAVDAALRGLSVALIERGDWASATSSRSTRLLHGGIRGLETGDIRLVAEAVAERNLVAQRLAPHLVRPASLLYPLTHRAWERAYAAAGGLLYDLLGRGPGRPRDLPGFRLLRRSECLAAAPCLRAEAVRGAVRLGEGLVDDARLTLELVRTAAALGARCVSRGYVTRLWREGGRVCGADWVDVETGRRLRTPSRVVVCAAGVWTPQLLAGVDRPAALPVRPSKGAHVVVPRDRIDSGSGLVLRTTRPDWRTRSFIFVVPWDRRYWILGTTDGDWPHDPDRPAATAADVDFILDRCNRLLRSPLRRGDVIAAYAGLHPLTDAGHADLSLASRASRVVRPLPGLVVTAGGKLTTYRRMAQRAVDAAVGPSSGPGTSTLPLLGARGWRDRRADLVQVGRQAGLPAETVDRLLGRFGTQLPVVLAAAGANAGLLQPLPGAPDHLQVEVTYAVQHEDARTLGDVLDRRTRIGVDDPDAALRAGGHAARLMAPLLGWSRARADQEVAAHRATVARRRAEQCAPDDASAASLGC